MFSTVKNLTLGGLLVALIGASVGWILKNSIEFNFCLVSEPTCINNLTKIGNALLYGMGALAIVFAILLFFPKAFEAWKKFAIWFIPIAAFLFIFYENPGSGDMFSPYAEQVYIWVSKLYIAISVAIIAIASRKATSNRK